MPIGNPERRLWLTRGGAFVISAALCDRVPAAADGDDETPDGDDSPQNYSDAPRLALVIGNGKYAASPLTNPPHDAAAMADLLRYMKFECELVVDATRVQMLTSIAGFCARLRQRKAVGLFYYAGHGTQQSWRNYLIPVDANIRQLDELAGAALDLGTLLDGLGQAKNPMNVLILDACRDDPFGSSIQIPAKGLSQFDAPPGTLLAYATAPGSTASDGAGSNGLYTGNLLLEMRDPKLRIEDVFKRVRLAVRRKSNGSQIPWESTSLEGDFYLLPDGAGPKLNEQQRKVKFDQSLADWNITRVSTNPDVVEAFLRRYPDGPYAETAQVTLNLLLAKAGERRVVAVSEPGNPYSKGTSLPDLHFKIGDSYEYRTLDLKTRVETARQIWTISAISDSQIDYNGGLRVTDLLGNDIGDFSIDVVKVLSPMQFLPAEYFVGRHWTTEFAVHVPAGAHYLDHDDRVELKMKIVGREQIQVPAGDFFAFKIVGRGFIAQNGQPFTTVIWVAPDKCRRPLSVLTKIRGNHKGFNVSERTELLSFHENTAIPLNIQNRDLSV